ncbi:MAG: anthranilate phosphoribosyltransferase, partial [Chloroflexota bacterium]|nr:anthranilate phosphoribosyltransferase [Dehalococcoidia bacterium]MDW8255383.1 anthranilate phosphoribosyltransferase [Chloroflexota bacterium]
SAQIAAFVVALRMKGETTDEIAGLASVMRAKAERVPVSAPVTDTCGTGGDRAHTFNISTTAAFVVAGGGLTVAKHGNRSVSSKSGSADVLEALGFAIDLGPEQVAQCLDESGFGFMFAQRYHPAMKHVAPTRREIGVRTVFNVLGPLTNPAGAAFQVIGVPDATLAPKMAWAARRLGVQRALVVVGHDGLDELSLAGPSRAYLVTPDGVAEQL